MISRQLEYYRRNKEKIKQKNREWKKNNKDKIDAYNEKNKEKRKVYFKKLYLKKKMNNLKKNTNKIVLTFD